jgi:hypothetical protein
MPGLPLRGVRLLLWFVMAGLLTHTAEAKTLTAGPSDYRQKLGQLAAGDTLELSSGRYTQGLSISNKNGDAQNWITIRGPQSGAAAIFIARSGHNTIELTNSSYVSIETLTVDAQHKAGLFGVSAKGSSNNTVHHIRIEGCTFINHDGSQQTVAISTKTPTWGWQIRRNIIRDAGTGLYLGNSNGNEPFIGGVIEENLIVDPLGYCMQIKWQKPRPSHPGIPTGISKTIIRNNVFIKNNKPGPDGNRPNLLVGGYPQSGAGKDDLTHIYGNFIFNNPYDSLIQASGRVVIHDNVLVGAKGTAITLRNHDLPLSYARVYNNTIYGGSRGISLSGSPSTSQVVGNLIFAGTGISGTIADKRDNLVAQVNQAASYVVAPSLTLGQMDFYPLAGKCEGSAIDMSAMKSDPAYDRDFNGASKAGFTFRGAYAGATTNPGWALSEAIKQLGAAPPPADGGVPSADGGAGLDGGVPSKDGAGPSTDAALIDRGVPTDASAQQDARAGDGSKGGGDDGGCAISARKSEGGQIVGFIVMALALGLFVRRKTTHEQDVEKLPEE